MNVRSFLCNRKLRFYYIKTLREDRTAADKKHVAYCDPPQAENLASEILYYEKISGKHHKRLRKCHAKFVTDVL